MVIKPLPSHPLIDAYAQATSESEKAEIASVFADDIYPTHPERSELMALILAHGGVLPKHELVNAVWRMCVGSESAPKNIFAFSEKATEMFIPHGFVTEYDPWKRLFSNRKAFDWMYNEPIMELRCQSIDDLQRVNLRRVKKATFANVDLFGAWSRVATTSLQEVEIWLHRPVELSQNYATSLTDTLFAALRFIENNRVPVSERLALYARRQLYDKSDVEYLSEFIQALRARPKHVVLHVTEFDQSVSQVQWTGNEVIHTHTPWNGLSR